MLEGFSDQYEKLPSGIGLRVRMAGEGPAVLLLHGYPQTHVCWHKVAPALVKAGFTVVLSDLRGYGGSDKPETDPDHLTYSKREMAADQVALMQQLGFETFMVAGHDRGGRVTHRLARDHSDRVTAVSLLDIAPTERMYERTDKAFATAYYHWFFLIQPAPLPERLIGNDPAFFLKSCLNGWKKSDESPYDAEAVAAYIAAFTPEAIHSTCEDYRASASVDLEHDRANSDEVLNIPAQALWGGRGVVGKTYDVVAEWRKYFASVEGAAFDCGHFLPEEAPEETAEALISFFKKHC